MGENVTREGAVPLFSTSVLIPTGEAYLPAYCGSCAVDLGAMANYREPWA